MSTRDRDSTFSLTFADFCRFFQNVVIMIFILLAVSAVAERRRWICLVYICQLDFYTLGVKIVHSCHVSFQVIYSTVC